MSRPTALIFDLDGTLVDTVGTRVEAWMETFPRYGIEPDREYLAPLMGYDGRQLARMVAEHHGVELEPGIEEEIDRESGERFRERNRHPRPLPGATALLERLTTDRTRWAIATSSRPDEAVASVDALALSERPLVCDGHDVEHAKPAPDLLLKAASLLEVAPADAWYIGDSRWDMVAATAAGMYAVGIPTGATAVDVLVESGAAVTYPSLHELEAAIDAA